MFMWSKNKMTQVQWFRTSDNADANVLNQFLSEEDVLDIKFSNDLSRCFVLYKTNRKCVYTAKE